MVEIYSAVDKARIDRQWRNCLVFFFSITALYAAAAVTLFVFYTLEYYGSPNLKYYKAAVYTITVLYAIFAYVYLSIRFSRVKRYRKLLGLIFIRKPTESVATFMRFNSDVTVKDGVDFKSMTLVEWSEKEKEYMERYVLLDMEKPFPDFRGGDEISFKTYSNVLTEYEITNRTVLEGTPFGEQKGE